MTRRDPFRYFKTSREIIRLAVMLYVRFPLSLRNVCLHASDISDWVHFGEVFHVCQPDHGLQNLRARLPGRSHQAIHP
jgi:hypothetical protein